MTRTLMTAIALGLALSMVAGLLAGWALCAFARALDRLDTVDD